MSWWVSIRDEGDNLLEVARHTQGGTYVLGGIAEAKLNITYNYYPHFHEVLDLPEGLRSLNGMSVYEALPHLERACAGLPDAPGSDYWAATPGNAGHALRILLGWCREAARTERDYRLSVH